MNAEETTLLIRRLLESFTDFHADLSISCREMHERVDWVVKANINDQGKLVGKLASHVKAVRYIVEELGAKAGIEYRLRLDDPKIGTRLPPSEKRKAPADYNPAPTFQLLYDLLVALLDAPPTIVPRPDESDGCPGWVFVIECKQVQDYERLVVPVEGDESNTTLIGVLGTLFRAAGYKDGVSFKVEVPSR